MVVSVSSLTTLPSSEFLAGSQVYVKTTDTYYKLLPNDGNTPDGVNYIAAMGGGNCAANLDADIGDATGAYINIGGACVSNFGVLT